MRRIVTLLATVAVLAAAATGLLIWRLTRTPAAEHPEISAYTHGQLVSVGPYQYCDVIEVTDCEIPRTVGELVVSSRDPVQLSVPAAIAKAPWMLIRAYEGSDSVVEEFRPGTRLVVTIPTVDPHHGRLTGIAVQLPTLVRDEENNEHPWAHAEWSVRTIWD